MIKTFTQAVKYLEGFIPAPDKKFLGRFGYERMKQLAQLLGNPQLKYPTIHVGGTSGKGSTATIIASILARKYNVGLNTSPHLEKITERIKTNGKDITEKDFVEVLNEIRVVIDEMKMSKWGSPSHFEILTAMAMVYFIKKKVDAAVFEVGMGGRWDGTNIVSSEVVVLTNVGLDHTQVLGDTVEKIAQDKVGIIKRNINVISGVKQASVIDIVNERCKINKAQLSLLGRDFSYKVKKLTEKGSVFDYFGEKTYRDLELNLLGEYQVENASIAIRAIEKFSNDTMLQFSNEDIREGIKRAFIPGRMEIVHRNPTVILDGAHNPDKIKSLVNSITKIFPKKRVICVLAIKTDKDAKKMLKYLLPICSEVILTRFLLNTDLGETYSYKPNELLKIIKHIDKNKEVAMVEEGWEALRLGIKKAGKEDLILVTGSLYLVGDIRRNYKL